MATADVWLQEIAEEYGKKHIYDVPEALRSLLNADTWKVNDKFEFECDGNEELKSWCDQIQRDAFSSDCDTVAFVGWHRIQTDQDILSSRDLLLAMLRDTKLLQLLTEEDEEGLSAEEEGEEEEGDDEDAEKEDVDSDSWSDDSRPPAFDEEFHEKIKMMALSEAERLRAEYENMPMPMVNLWREGKLKLTILRVPKSSRKSDSVIWRCKVNRFDHSLEGAALLNEHALSSVLLKQPDRKLALSQKLSNYVLKTNKARAGATLTDDYYYVVDVLHRLDDDSLWVLGIFPSSVDLPGSLMAVQDTHTDPEEVIVLAGPSSVYGSLFERERATPH